MLTLTYEMYGTGWAYLTVSDGSVVRRMQVSYLGADIRDLIWTTPRLLDGSPEESILFETEPGEHVWRLTRTGDDLRIAIDSWEEWLIDDYEDTWGNEEFTFEHSLPLRDFAALVANAANALIAQWGAEGYEEKWLHGPFPIEKLERLNTHLRS